MAKTDSPLTANIKFVIERCRQLIVDIDDVDLKWLFKQSKQLSDFCEQEIRRRHVK